MHLITSKRGMTPWCDGIKTLREAQKESKAARQQGLDGEIVEYEDVEEN